MIIFAAWTTLYMYLAEHDVKKEWDAGISATDVSLLLFSELMFQQHSQYYSQKDQLSFTIKSISSQ